MESLLIHELLPREVISDDEKLARAIKALGITLSKERPLDEAISTSGGVCIEKLGEHFEFKKMPRLFFMGEMLNWDAPTGGYLLQGCFSTAYHVVQRIINEGLE